MSVHGWVLGMRAVQVVADKDCHCCSHELHLLFCHFLKGPVQAPALAIGSATSAAGQ